MKSIYFGVTLLFLIILFSCSTQHEEAQEKIIVAPLSELSAPPALDENFSKTDDSKSDINQDTPTVNKKKIIKDGNISVKTNDIAASKKSIDKVLKSLNAYYEQEELQNNDQLISYNLKIRIPAENFEKLIIAIENGKDEIKNKSIQARDVTEEYIDIETRLTNKREYLKRYQELLSKASTVKDILAIEENSKNTSRRNRKQRRATKIS